MIRKLSLAVLLLGGLATRSADAQSWCDRAPRAGYQAYQRVEVRDPWFHVYRIEPGTFAIYEPYNFQEIISWLIVGDRRAVLFDTGMGMSRISALVRELTRLPVTVVNSHSHFDHIGGNAEFSDVRGMDTDYTRASAGGVPHAEVAQEVRPDAFCARMLRTPIDTAAFSVRPYRISGLIGDGTVFDLGGRRLEVLAVPGHTPDAIALLDRERGHLWTGDTYYPGPIWLYFPGTDLDAYQASIERLAALAPSLTRVFPAHNLPVSTPDVLPRVRDAFRQVRSGAVSAESRGEGMAEYGFEGFSFLMRAPEPPLRVLFIGNSYTYYNNLPAMLEDFARGDNAAREVRVEMVVRGGATLRDHWTTGDALAAIRRGPWDYVVLQDQSMLGITLVEGRPSVNDPGLLQSFGRLFAREIAAAGAKPVFYLTWSRRSMPELQPRLNAAYGMIARETGALLAPVGPAWQAVLAARPDLDLYDPDGSHPSAAGSYLAAATIWATISGRPARGLPSSVRGRVYTENARGAFYSDSTTRLAALTAAEATTVQQLVDDAVQRGLPASSASATFEHLPPLPAGETLSPARLEGRWVGTMRLYDAPVDVTLIVTAKGTAYSAEWRVVGPGWSTTRQIPNFVVEGSELSFSVPEARILTPPELHRAVLVGDTLIGRASIGSALQVPRLIGSWTMKRAGTGR